MSEDLARLLKPLPMSKEKIVAFRRWAREEWERGSPAMEIMLAAERPPWKSKTDAGEWIN
jgi:hypothetical protein